MSDDARYFLDQDSSGHWYVVEEAHRDAWSAWRDLPEDDELGWNAPECARAVGGNPNLITFESPKGMA